MKKISHMKGFVQKKAIENSMDEMIKNNDGLMILLDVIKEKIQYPPDLQMMRQEEFDHLVKSLEDYIAYIPHLNDFLRAIKKGI